MYSVLTIFLKTILERKSRMTQNTVPVTIIYVLYLYKNIYKPIKIASYSGEAR